MLKSVARRLLRGLRFLLLLALMVVLLQWSSVPLGLRWYAVAAIAQDYQFDYLTWTLNALLVKLDQTLYGRHPFMTEADRSAFVRAYMADLERARRLEAEIAALYADPQMADPDAASAALRQERETLRADLRRRQPLAEAILEGQVAAALVEQGFGAAGQILPPVAAHFTQVPNLLVVSPRDAIRFDVSINLEPMTAEAIAALEAQVDAQLDVSSLVVPLGGIALYPAMILETASIPWALDTIAHEWLHHYLFAFPLGLAYFDDESFAAETRIINETVASLFGRELSRLTLARYYPDLLPPPPSRTAAAPPLAAAAPAFDFGREMDVTRRRVDALLAEGQVAEAEAYMEARRRLFYEQGYPIRKLNQAYFAFYGGYQSGAPGAGGADPIGPAVQAIRDASPSLHEWVVTMRGITSRQALLEARDRLAGS